VSFNDNFDYRGFRRYSFIPITNEYYITMSFDVLSLAGE